MMLLPSAWHFPLFGRCSSVLSLEKTDSTHRRNSGIERCLTLPQNELFHALQSDLCIPPEWQVEPYPRPEYVLHLHHGYVTHQGGYITHQSELIEELSQKYDYPIADHQHLHSLRLFKRIKRLKQPLVSLAGAGQYNYYHWWLDILPRLHLLQAYGEIPDEALYYMETAKAFQRDTLHYLGIPEAKWLNSRQVQAVRSPLILGATPKSPSRRPDPWAVGWLRQRFLPMGEPPQESAPCVVVSRRKVKNRRILNEEEMMQVLAPLHPRLVELEDLTVAQQIGLFAQARWVIAPHGAGLTNLLFVPKTCHVIELFGSQQTNDCYPLLAEMVDCSHTSLWGEDVKNSEKHHLYDMRVHLEKLKSMLLL